MASYRLTVEATEPNANFAEQMEEMKRARQNAYNYGGLLEQGASMGPAPTTTRTVLTVELTEQQWRAVRDAAVGGWA